MTKNLKYYVPRWQALAEPAKNEPSETACRMAGTEIYDFDGEENNQNKTKT